MPDIKNSVGAAGAQNKVHDVALVQAMLRVVKDAKARPYLAGEYDGVYGNQTKTAIQRFQAEKVALPTPPAAGKDKVGLVTPGGMTIQKLNNLLPADYKTMTIIENTKTVYLAGDAADLTASKKEITTKADLEAAFRTKVGDLVQAMHKAHKIVLWVTKSGWRRTFAEQAALNPKSTKAGPGESNHNFGRAVDLGFRNLRWVKGNGAIVKDNDWLGQLEAASAAKANAFWNARDAIALKAPIGLFRLKFERIHLQAFDDATVSSTRSLADLLTRKGKFKWEPRYKSDLGGGGALFPVGDAKTIWAGNASVSKAEIAAAKKVPPASVTAKDIADMRKALKADFEAAETNWADWKAIP